MFRIVVIATALLALCVGPLVAAAQEATPAAPASPLAELGYPELRIKGTEAGFELPADVPAGRTLVTLENAGMGGANSIILVQLSDGLTMADLAPAPGTPGAEEEAPDWFYEARIVGSSLALNPGEQAQVAADLTPGDWAVLPYSEGPQAPQQFTVTAGDGATPPAGPAPTAHVTVTEQDFAFVGLEGPIPAGPQAWKVTNQGPQPHEMALLRFPVPVTFDQVMMLPSLFAGATPPPDFGFRLEEIQFVDGVAALSAGQAVWAAFDLPPGNYAAVCFVADRETGMPHAAMGMVQVFTVGDGTGSPTP